MEVLCFTGKDNDITIEKFIKNQKSVWGKNWKFLVVDQFKDEATTWWELLNKKKLYNLLDEEFEKLLFY